MKSTIPQTAKLDITEIYRLIDAGHSQGAVSRQLGCSQGYISRLLKARRLKGAPSEPDGELLSEPGEPTALQRIESPGLPQSAPGLPDIARQSDVDALATRVEVLEAFIASLQQQHTTPPGSPNGSPVVHPVHSGSPSGSPTHKRGFVLADDLWDTIHSYAEAHHWQIAQVVDLALRTFFAQVGQEVGDA